MNGLKRIRRNRDNNNISNKFEVTTILLLKINYIKTIFKTYINE